jgi:hypothetical protein
MDAVEALRLGMSVSTPNDNFLQLSSNENFDYSPSAMYKMLFED